MQRDRKRYKYKSKNICDPFFKTNPINCYLLYAMYNASRPAQTQTLSSANSWKLRKPRTKIIRARAICQFC